MDVLTLTDQWTFFFFACMGSILGFAPLVVLMMKGKQIREKLGAPKNVNQFDTDGEVVTAELPY